MATTMEVEPADDMSRILIIIRSRSTMFRQDPNIVIKAALLVLGLSSADATLLVHEKWQRMDILVVDLHNDASKFDAAHYITDIPVLELQYGRSGTRVAVASQLVKSQVNEGVARHYNLHGWDKYPPFYEDHTLSRPPTYYYPRDPTLLSVDGTQHGRHPTSGGEVVSTASDAATNGGSQA